MKKIIAALSAAAILALSPVSVSAQKIKKYDDVEMKQFECVDCFKDGTLTISISAELPNVSGVHLRLDYDNSKLKFVSHETKIGHGELKEHGATLEWSSLMNAQGQKLVYFDTIADFTFEILEDIESTDKCISVGVVEAYNSDMKDIDFLSHTALNVGASGTYGNVGDANKDGAIDSTDALVVLRASASTEKVETVFSYLADINRDNVVDSTDALIILRHSVGLDSSET